MIEELTPIIETEEAKVLIKKEHGKEQNIKIELLELIQQGDNPFDIIYKVAQWLEVSSAERGYAQHILENIRTIYGMALGDKKLLEDEIKDTEQRASQIRFAYAQDGFSDEEKARMGFSIRAHEAKIEKLKKILACDG